jgi:hypothetical protein
MTRPGLGGNFVAMVYFWLISSCGDDPAIVRERDARSGVIQAGTTLP